MKRERSEDETEGGPSKLQRHDSNAETARGNDSAPQTSSKVRKGTECPYLDTIARQVELVALFSMQYYQAAAMSGF